MKKIGIADAHGIESYLSEDDGKVNLGMLSLRASLNRQRHALVYNVELTKAQDMKVKKFIEEKDWAGALTYIKENAKEVSIQKGCEKSWNMIPNHDLDPWY